MHPKLMELEFRNEETKAGEGFHLIIHWFEIFWSEDASTNYMEIASDADEHGDYVYEQVTLIDKDCFSFRGKTYDFMAIRPIDTDEIVEVVRALWEMVKDTHDVPPRSTMLIENIYIDGEKKSFTNQKVEEVISTLSGTI